MASRKDQTTDSNDGAQATQQTTSAETQFFAQTRVGIYGWRKYGVYAIIITLLSLAIINLGLIVYMWRVLLLTSHGAGPVKFDSDRIRISGSAEFANGVIARNISSYTNQSLTLASTNQIQLVASTGESAAPYSQVSVAPDAVVFETSRFEISHLNKSIMTMTAAQTTLDTAKVTVDSTSGLVVKGAIQTSLIHNEHDHALGLTIESVGQSLALSGTSAISISSSSSTVDVSALLDITLTSKQGAVVLDSPVIKLPSVLPKSAAASSGYQLCVCALSGLLYSVQSPALCEDQAGVVCA